MKMMQIVVIFLSLFVMLGGLALPLYWAAVQPYVLNFPVYAQDVMRNIISFIDTVNSIV